MAGSSRAAASYGTTRDRDSSPSGGNSEEPGESPQEDEGPQRASRRSRKKWREEAAAKGEVALYVGPRILRAYDTNLSHLWLEPSHVPC